MNLRKFFCCLLACALCFSALFSTSAYARSIDGYDVKTYYSSDSLNYSQFDGSIVINQKADPLYINVVVTFPEDLPAGSTFDLELKTSLSIYSTITASAFLYDKNQKCLSIETPVFNIVENPATGIDETYLHLVNTYVAGGDLHTISFFLTINEPRYFENIIYQTYNFTINGTGYSVLEGYSWSNFAESAHNDGSIYIGSDGYVYSTYSKGKVYYYGNPALGTDLIVNNQDYHLTDDGSIYEPPTAITNTFYFSAGDVRYGPFTYEVGMTWKQFVNSSYNPDHSVLLQKVFTLNTDDNLVYFADNTKRLLAVSANEYSTVRITSDISQANYGDRYYWQLHAISGVAVVEYINNFSVIGVTVTLQGDEELNDGILGWIKNIFNGVTGLPQLIANNLKGFFDNLGKSITDGFDTLSTKLLDGIRVLFVPSEEDLLAYKSKWESLLADRFGAVYQSAEIIDNWANSFLNTPATIPSGGDYGGNVPLEGQIYIPVVKVNLAGVPFSFGGYLVDIIPHRFEGVVETLKLITNIACSFLFVNAMRKRLEGLLH